MLPLLLGVAFSSAGAFLLILLLVSKLVLTKTLMLLLPLLELVLLVPLLPLLPQELQLV